MISRNLRARRPFGAAVEQRLDVAAHRGQRRAQFVRDVGDEVAPHPIGAAQIGDVVQHDHRAGRAVGRATGARAHRDDQAVLQRQLDALALAAARAPRSPARRCPGGARSRGSAGPRPLPAAAASGGRRRWPAAPVLGVDDQDAFGHAAEDRFHARAVGGELVGAPADLADRVVQGARDRCRFRRCRSRGPAARSRRRRSGSATSAIARTRRSGAPTRPRPAAARRRGPAPAATSAVRRSAAS